MVPENRANPTGPTVRVSCGTFQSHCRQPGTDPILYLEGGPGGSPLRAYTKNFDIYFGAYAEKRDGVCLLEACTAPAIRHRSLDSPSHPGFS